jgi:hypothetical protein
MVGGSQIGRMAEEMGQKGKDAVEVEGWVKVNGSLDRTEMESVVERVVELGKISDKVIIGGPGNSLFKHGRGDVKGFCPERTVKVERKVDGEVPRVSVQYHMTEPEKLTMSEKRELIDNVVELARRIGESLPGIQIVYITMFPRFVDRCCSTAGHMTKEDILVMSGFRKTVDCDLVEELEESGSGGGTLVYSFRLGWRAWTGRAGKEGHAVQRWCPPNAQSERFCCRFSLLQGC